MTLFSEEVDEKTMKNGLRMSRSCGNLRQAVLFTLRL